MRQLLLPFEPLSFHPKLSDFLPGKNAELLHQIALALLENQESAIFYVWGSKGTGKTHLMEAVAYAAIVAGKTPALLKPACPFPAFFQVLLIDPIECFEKEEQSALIAPLDEAIVNGALVFATGRFPLKSGHLRPDLASRFTRGLVYPLLLPDEDSMEAMIWRRAKALALELSPSVVRYMRYHLPNNPRDLVLFLEKLAAYSLSESKPVTVNLVKKLLENNFLA